MPSPENNHHQKHLPVYDEGVGYGLIVGVGAVFAICMAVLSILLARFMAQVQTSEMFLTAKHSVKTGLIASAVVSSWTIVATCLSSTTEGYLYGVSGPFWYGAGATVQIFLFGVAAIELKRKAPRAHTFLEVVHARYGPPAHIVLLCYSLFFQIFNSVNLLVGGSSLTANITGANRDVCCFLLPVAVVVYTSFGGIKATFFTDWAHTIVIYAIMLMSVFVVYTSSDTIGSPKRMHELLSEAAALHPVKGNAGGSYLTMKSENGGYVGLIFIGAGFASAVDSQLFQKAIAADPAATLSGYMLGGLCWFTIPFVLASTFGLAAAATEHLPSFPTYPERMTAKQVTDGLAMPFAAMALMGNGGALAILLMVTMAVTSALSSDTVATAALISIDIYKTYIHKDADSRRLVLVSRVGVISFGILISCVAVGFNHAGFSVQYMITAIGIFVDSAIIPMACTVMWRKQNLLAVVAAPIVSSIAAIVAWLMTAYTHEGEVTIASTSTNLPLVAGNMMSLCGPIVLTPLFTYTRPDNFDWQVLKQLKTDRGAIEEEMAAATLQHYDGGRVVNVVGGADADASHEEEMDKRLKGARNKAVILSAVLCLSFLIIWPIPMYGSGYIFSAGFFTGWIVVVFLWAFFAAIVITSMPIVESRKDIVAFFRYICSKKGTDILEGQVASRSSQEQAQMTVKN